MDIECRRCGDPLTDANWQPSQRKIRNYVCRNCENARLRSWKKENPDKVREQSTRSRRKKGHLSMSENKKCSSYLGVHIAEILISSIYENVEVMPYGNPGYDIVCANGFYIDVKGGCLRTDGSWLFHIRYNKIADYFVLLAFDNRDNTNPLHCWMIPGDIINHLSSTSISKSTIDKWDEYRLDIDRVISCCNQMKME